MTGPAEPVLAVGIMSGTSLDGITAAVTEIGESAPDEYAVRLVGFVTQPYTEEQRERIEAVMLGAGAGGAGAAGGGGAGRGGGGPRELALLDADLGGWLAEAAAAALRSAGAAASDLAFVASHGQTIWHEPGRASLQIGRAAVIAERLGARVVSDFRARDIAAGGQGAPLVAIADRLLFSRPDASRVLLNLGGIANITLVPPAGDSAPVIAFDTGPGVAVLNACVRRLFPGRSFDEGGRIALGGRPTEAVVDQALAHPYFRAPPPKSTGRELFGTPYADDLVRRCADLGGSPADAVATAVEITARAVAQAAERFLPAARRPLDVVRSGGGARNPALVAALERAWPLVEHRAFDDLFFDGDAKEAVAFAFLGYLTLSGRPGNAPEATGARGPRILGSVTPA